MAKEVDNRLRWERVPVLGKNPVFCFEARRVWTRRAVMVLLIIMLGVAAVVLTVGPALAGRVSWSAFHNSGAVARAALQAAYGAEPPWVPSSTEVLRWIRPSSAQHWAHGVVSLLSYGLYWTAIVGARYLVSVLAAVSMAGDRTAGRLEPVLASRMSPRHILLGRVMAPAFPFVLLVFAHVIISAPRAIGEYGAPSRVVPPLQTVVALLVAALVGVRVGASTRQAAAAVGVSVVLTGVLFPMLTALAGHLAYVALSEPSGLQGSEITLLWATELAEFVLSGAVLVVLWFSTKRALVRAVE